MCQDHKPAWLKMYDCDMPHIKTTSSWQVGARVNKSSYGLVRGSDDKSIRVWAGSKSWASYGFGPWPCVHVQAKLGILKISAEV